MALMALAALVTSMTGCAAAPPPGGSCEVSGDGFTRRDECDTTCVDWEITCEDGSSAEPDVCSAGSCTDGQACAKGFHCLSVGVSERECLPEDICAVDASAPAQP